MIDNKDEIYDEYIVEEFFSDEKLIEDIILDYLKSKLCEVM